MSVAQVSAKADQWFKRGAYYRAFNEYRELIARNPGGLDLAVVALHTGICCLRMNDYIGAEEWLLKAMKSGCEEPGLYYMLGDVALSKGNYREAKVYFIRYHELVPEDQRTGTKIASCDFGLVAPKENPGIMIEPLPLINTRGSEYGVSFVRGGILYSSTGDLLPERRREISQRTGMGFSKPYFSLLKEGEYQPGKPLKGISRHNANEGTFAYDEMTGELYCTRCEENQENCDIIRAQLRGETYHETGILKTGKRRYNMAHPFVTENGSRIYFSSTLEGGYGGTDIWYIDKQDGEWGEPVNAGPKINTPGNEVFPYVWENLFFFASDGHVGYGGLDIYRCKRTDDGHWEKPENLGASLNTSYDDFNLVVHSDGMGGLLVSNRNPGRSDDIFRFELRSFIILLSGTVKDKATEQSLPRAKVLLSEGEQLTEITTDRKGEFALMLTNGVRYRLSIEMPGYQPVTEEIRADNYVAKPFDMTRNRIEKVWFLEPVRGTEAALAGNLPETEPVKEQKVEADTVRPVVKKNWVDHLPYRLGVEVKEVIQQGWWVQVAMLRESRIIDYGTAMKITELTGKRVVMYKGEDGGHRFYVGVYYTEEEARQVVSVLKEAGMDCFIKQVTD